MKTPLICLSLVGCSTVFLTSCTDTIVNSTEQGLSGYALGAAKGKHDSQTGLSRRPDRYKSSYSESDRSEYLRGYESGYNEGVNAPKIPHTEADNPFDNVLAARPSKGNVQVFDGSRQISSCRTALPNIEDYRFIHSQQHLVVKSRGSHGPAKVELFETRNGQKLETIDAVQIKDGKPLWAVGMSEE